jgi:cysteine desulfurase
MNAEPIYLDHAATTPVRPEVREAMLPFLGERFGNPSSAHRWGQEAGAALEDARARLAGVIGASPSRIVFTAGGTEADNLAISGRARATGGTRPVACSAVEHRAVLEACRGLSELGITHHTLPVDREGRVEMDALDVVLRDEPCVVSVMWVNNEVGTIQPVEEIGARCREAGVVFHTDAVQALGKLPVRMDMAPVDLMAISAHKVGGPKGAGALYIREGVEIAPVIRGGSHERGLRAGTHNVAGAVGFARAAELAAAEMERETARLGALRDRLEAALRESIPDLRINGGAVCCAGTLNVCVPGIEREPLLLSLDLEGIAVSAGSACSSGASTASHVLTAMGVPEDAGPSIRFSLGHETTEAEIERVIRVVPPLVERLRAMSAA